ncbi:MAG: hypothetical protein H6R15_2254 [Proteobacteria bacterium]|nr:hypothetical protein [Pseudomonadota bacterium]
MPSSEPITNNKLFNWSVISLVVLLTAILIVLSYADLSGRESALFGTVLTFASILAGGLITHAYAQRSNAEAIADVADFHQRNLRTYALKAAEKVNNLSKELARLSTYLTDELDETDYRSVDEELLAKEERIQSTIHMLDTLRSVNDTSLSDWRGVIGEELNEQQVEQAERTEEINELLDRFSTLEAAHLDVQKKFDSIALQQELEELKKGLRTLVKDVTGVPLKRSNDKGYVLLSESCPSCGSIVSYRQKPRPQSPKAITCKNCGLGLISEYSEIHGFSLRVRKLVPESVTCISCENVMSVELDEWPTASATLRCENCEENIRVSRASGVLKISVIPQLKSKYPLTDEIIHSVRDTMPSQPWPKHIHKTVAEKLGLPPQQIQRAIKHLINIGVFMDQIDGQICTPAEKLAILRSAGQEIS